MYGCHKTFSSLTKIKQVIGEKAEREKLSSDLKTLALNTKHQARKQGVILDSDLNFETHIMLFVSVFKNASAL